MQAGTLATDRMLSQPLEWMRKDGWTRLGPDGWRTPDDRDVCAAEAEDFAIDLLAVALERDRGRTPPGHPLPSPLEESP